MLYNSLDDDDEYDGYVTQSQGDLETLVGIVTNYDAKVLENGSIECSLEITSKNSAMLGFEFGESSKIENRINYILDSAILYYGIMAIANEDDRQKLSEAKANSSSSPKEVQEFGELLDLIAEKYLGLTNFNISDASLETGVFVTNNKNYICWGLFEDLILNSEFGFGGGDTSNENNFKVEIDSSNSFTSYNKWFNERQNVFGFMDLELDILCPVK